MCLNFCFYISAEFGKKEFLRVDYVKHTAVRTRHA